MKKRTTRAAERRSIDRAILRWARQISWGTANTGKLEIHSQDQIEIVGLVLARKRVGR